MTAARIEPLIVALAWACACRPHDPPRDGGARVLFVGNSYTAVNDLPGALRRLGDAMKMPFDVEAITPGGSTMAMHLADRNVLTRIRDGHFRFVVLQGQSSEPLTEPASFSSASVKLAGLVRAAGATPVFYETWARKKGSSDYDAAWSGRSVDEMQSRLRESYRRVATDSNAKLAPVGDALERAEVRAANLVYYAADGSHPSVATTFLAASVFFETLTGSSALGATGPAELTLDQVRTLEQAAHDTVTGAAP